MKVIESAGHFTPPGEGESSHWTEHLRIADLSAGTYSVSAGSPDDQSPHTEDEIYVVTSGRARLRSGEESVAVGPGSVVYVPAGEEHRFVDVDEDLAVLVLFAPAEYSRS